MVVGSDKTRRVATGLRAMTGGCPRAGSAAVTGHDRRRGGRGAGRVKGGGRRSSASATTRRALTLGDARRKPDTIHAWMPVHGRHSPCWHPPTNSSRCGALPTIGGRGHKKKKKRGDHGGGARPATATVPDTRPPPPPRRTGTPAPRARSSRQQRTGGGVVAAVVRRVRLRARRPDPPPPPSPRPGGATAGRHCRHRRRPPAAGATVGRSAVRHHATRPADAGRRRRRRRGCLPCPRARTGAAPRCKKGKPGEEGHLVGGGWGRAAEQHSSYWHLNRSKKREAATRQDNGS